MAEQGRVLTSNAETAGMSRRTWTYADLNVLPRGRFEIIDGAMNEMPPAGFEHGEFENFFGAILRGHLKDKGYVAVGEVGIVIQKNPLRLRGADVVYISKETVAEKPRRMLEIPPDLVVEILSEDAPAHEINAKVRDYLEFGVRRVVLVDPAAETVAVHTGKGSDSGFFTFDQEFTLVEDLRLRVRDLL